MSSRQISVTMSAELLSAIAAEAFENDETPSATVRAILTDHLRDVRRMSLKAPPTLQLGQHNSRYVTGNRA